MVIAFFHERAIVFYLMVFYAYIAPHLATAGVIWYARLRVGSRAAVVGVVFYLQLLVVFLIFEAVAMRLY